MLMMVMGNLLFAHEKGEVFLRPEVQFGLEIPNIHLENEHPKGDYVSLGLDWGARVTAGYYFFKWLGAEAGLGFGGFHDRNSYKLRNSTAALTETWDYDAGYFIIPVGVRLNRERFAAGVGLTAHIPVFFNFSGVSRDAAVKPVAITDINDDNFRIQPFLGGYIDIGYDWAADSEAKKGGFGIYLRTQFPFDTNIGAGDNGFTAFQHAGLSVIVSYCFPLAQFPIK
ncbi:hypothetical protein FACS1894106_2130 [Spirochaetia bacterium]|nr:hypothetical protein FACS1894106_2130 [Spirochaetia bacterium]